MKPESEWLKQVYTDESYLPHCIQNNEFYCPEDDKYEAKSPGRGRQFCFVAAIGHSSAKESVGLIRNSPWIFSPSSKKDRKGDYHKFFNHSNYVLWFT